MAGSRRLSGSAPFRGQGAPKRMITGVVRFGEARVRLTVSGPASKQRIEAVIDTGFTASLSLPPDIIKKLGLKWRSVERSILADGSECLVDVFNGNAEWDGKARR